MTYVVTEGCIRCKFQDCVEVCPVDAFFEGENMLVIGPDECIDCGVCEAECPVEAIEPDTVADQQWIDLNAKYAALWPLISSAKDAPDDAESFEHEPNKFERFFSEKPGSTDG